MFTISVHTYNGDKVTKSIINKELAIDFFKAFCSAEDAKQVTMINGLTGEVLYDYSTKNGWEVFNGLVIGF